MIVRMADHYRLSFERAPCVLVVTDRDGAILDVNEAAARLLGASRAELVGRPVERHADRLRRVSAEGEAVVWGALAGNVDPVRVLWEVFDEFPVGLVTLDTTGRVRRANAAARRVLGQPERLEEGVGWLGAEALAGRRVERRHLRLDAGWDIEVSAMPFHGADGDVNGAVVTIEDVSGRSRRERAERDFVSNAAHQLRSPLTAITSAVAVLRSAAATDEATRTRFLDHVERETVRIVRLTHALLTLARVERDGMAPRPVVVPVGPLLDALAEEERASGAVVAVDVDRAAAVVANEELLVEALTNLLANAVRHGGGAVVLRGRRAAADVVLEVVDEGSGMSPEVLERAFERFYRPEGARAGGFGLGLPIARAAARAAGGELAIESAPGAGTTARIRFPGAKLL
jgi:signal transduction histidine kinase